MVIRTVLGYVDPFVVWDQSCMISDYKGKDEEAYMIVDCLQPYIEQYRMVGIFWTNCSIAYK